MRKKNVTIGDLARMVQKGLMKQQRDADGRFNKFNRCFKDIGRRFNGVDKHLEKIEKLLIVNHREKIERLEMEVKNLKELLAVK